MEPEQDQRLPDEQKSGDVVSSGGGEQTGPASSGGALPYKPGVNPGAVDVTGKISEEIRIDPNITEGHPGYEDSGDSEIIPNERLGGGGTTVQET